MSFDVIPDDRAQDFKALRPGRKLIISTFYRLHAEDRRSPHKIIPKIAQELGYKIDSNGSNSYLLRVIQEFSDG